VIEADGSARWRERPRQIEPRGQWSNLALSGDGMLVEFGPKEWGADHRLRVDVAALRLRTAADDGAVAPPEKHGLDVCGWVSSTAQTLDCERLPLDPDEMSRSLAIHPDVDRFVLGADWALRAFERDGAALWRRSVTDT
jgi:hypothetical protein